MLNTFEKLSVNSVKSLKESPQETASGGKDENRKQKIDIKRWIKLVAWTVCLAGLVASGLSIAVLISGCRMDDLTINFYFKETQEMMWPTVRIASGTGIGTGVVIDGSTVQGFNSEPVNSGTNELFVLTASHVVGDESTVTVEFFYPAITEIQGTVVVTDTDKDLALVRCESGVVRPAFAKLAPQDYILKLFTPVWAVGCSLGLPPRPSQGIISSVKPARQSGGSVESAPTGGCALVEITAPIVPGNSGGPVYIRNGSGYEVIGITVNVKVYRDQLITTMAGIVPINQIYEFLKQTSVSSSATGGALIQCLPDEVLRYQSSNSYGNYFRASWYLGTQAGAMSQELGQLTDLTLLRKGVRNMAQITFTGGVQSIRGTINNMVFKLWKTGVTTIQNKPTSVRNPGTAEQGAVRQLFSTIAKRWLQNLTQNDRDAWETLAKAGPYRINREGGVRAVIRTNNKKYSGKNACLMANALAASVGGTTPIDTPQLHQVAPLEPVTPAAAYDGTKITVTWGDIPNIMPSDFVRVWIGDASGDVHKQMVDFAPAAAKTLNMTAVRGANGASFDIPRFEGGVFYIQLDTVSQATGLASAPSPCMVLDIVNPVP